MQNIDQRKIGDYGTEGDHYWAAQDNMFASTFAATKEVYSLQIEIVTQELLNQWI